jgi:MFS transporter, DHA1 family, tetracycline resistance protein
MNAQQPVAERRGRPTLLGGKAAVGFILVTILLDVLSSGIIIPSLAPLIQTMEGGDAAAAGAYMGVFGMTWAFAQFVASPVLGALSDRFGRRPVILISLFGLALDYVLMALAPTLGWLFVGRVISGLTAASFATASAYIADVTPPDQRAQRYGLIGAAWGVGFIVGPAIGGVLADMDVRAPFWGAAALTFAGAVYGLFILPESLARENRSPFTWAKANPLGTLAFLRGHRELLPLASLSFLLQLAHNVLPVVYVLYATNRYGWDLKATGLGMAAFGVGNIVVQMLLVKPVVARIGEWGALFTGLAFGGIGFLAMGLAPNGLVFLLAAPVFCLIGFFNPGYQGLATRRVAANEQGRWQGANSSLMGLAGVIGPLVFGYAYAWEVSPEGIDVPGAAFYLAAALHGAAVLLALLVVARPPNPAKASA